jgi:alkyl hydroperoxide reductase subunit D
MSVESLKSLLPDWAKDIRLNVSSIPTSTSLNEQQLWGTLLATAIASRNETVLAAIDEEASDHLSHEAKEAAKASAAIMSMNNVYYRASHLLGNDEYIKMPARLRMNVIGNPGVEKEDFELWCLAVSAINGCGTCLESHERVVIEKGLTTQQVQDAVRVAAIMHAAAVTLEAEDHFYAATTVQV